MININKQKEEEFYAKKDFCFSYSSLNKLLFSPSLFYKDYILFDREVRTDKHLIEGKLIHCLLFEPKEVDNKFSLMPGKSPSDNIRKVLIKICGVLGNVRVWFELSHQNDIG